MTKSPNLWHYLTPAGPVAVHAHSHMPGLQPVCATDQWRARRENPLAIGLQQLWGERWRQSHPTGPSRILARETSTKPNDLASRVRTTGALCALHSACALRRRYFLSAGRGVCDKGMRASEWTASTSQLRDRGKREKGVVIRDMARVGGRGLLGHWGRAHCHHYVPRCLEMGLLLSYPALWGSLFQGGGTETSGKGFMGHLARSSDVGLVE